MIVDRERVAAALPGYMLGQQLGSGAFGLVLAAEHRRMGRAVAVKVMPAETAEGVRVDFAAEARVLGQLDHPHVVRVFDYVEAEGLCLVVMELLAGGTLTRRRRSMSPEQACAAGLAVASALRHAHERGILHRDIKADNILFAADGTLKVTDFGIAKLFEGSAATASGMIGTPMYMAPEQIEGGRLGPATDLYALGVVLYRLLTGRAPFDPKQPLPMLWRQHLSDPPPPMLGVPAPVAAVVLRVLAKAPSDRHRDATAFALGLARAATQAYGAGWSFRVGAPLHLDDAVRRATDPQHSLVPAGRDDRTGAVTPAGLQVTAPAPPPALPPSPPTQTPPAPAPAPNSTGARSTAPVSSSVSHLGHVAAEDHPTVRAQPAEPPDAWVPNTGGLDDRPSAVGASILARLGEYGRRRAARRVAAGIATRERQLLMAELGRRLVESQRPSAVQLPSISASEQAASGTAGS